MPAKFICTILFFIFSNQVFSQTSSVAISYSYGITQVPTDASNNSFISYGNSSGTISSVEFSNIPENNTGYFVNFTTTTYKLDEHYVEYILENHLLQNYALTFGARVYINDNRIFFDMGAGYYNIESFHGHVSLGWETGGSRDNTSTAGLNFGIGTRVLLGKTMAVVLKSKLNLIGLNEGLYELNFNAGLELNNSKQVFNSSIPGNFSTGLILGNSGKANDRFVGVYGAELTCSISDNFSLIANYLHKKSERYFLEDFNFIDIWENNYSGGVRNYFGRSNLKPFIECLANLNIQKTNFRYDNSFVNNSIGLVFGTGAEFDLTDRVTGILKGNITFFDNIDNAAGMFGGLKYRF